MITGSLLGLRRLVHRRCGKPSGSSHCGKRDSVTGHQSPDPIGPARDVSHVAQLGDLRSGEIDPPRRAHLHAAGHEFPPPL